MLKKSFVYVIRYLFVKRNVETLGIAIALVKSRYPPCALMASGAC